MFGAVSCSGATLPPPRATPAPVATSRPSYKVEDATAPFWEFWKRAKDASPADQVQLFKDIVIRAHPELYTSEVVAYPPVPNDWLDAKLTRFIATLPPLIPAMETLSARLRSDLVRYDSTFRAAFPDMKWSGTVYFTIALGAFDGGTRPVNGNEALLFGIDKIASLHGPDASLSALFHHEIFHIYQADVAPSVEHDDATRGLLDHLWEEGLAVYVSKRLNPDATWKQIMLSDDVELERMMKEGTARLPQLASELRRNLDVSTPEMYRDYFLNSKRPEVPPRVGYFVGYLVAKRVAKGRPLPATARIRGAELRREVDRELAYFEAGGSP
jgi:hypothetical protein